MHGLAYYNQYEPNIDPGYHHTISIGRSYHGLLVVTNVFLTMSITSLLFSLFALFV